MADDTGQPGPSGDERHDPWAPPRDGVAPGRGSMEQNDEDRRRRSVAEQPTITSGNAAAPPPVPPAPGAPPGGAGGAPGSGYGSSPYGSPAAYGQHGHQQYGKTGAAYGYPAPGPQPYGYGPGAGPGYGPGGPGWHTLPPSNGKSVASMVVGIIGLVATCTCWGSFLGIILAPVALGLGLSARRACDRGEAGGRGQAVAGFVMGIIGTVLSALIVALLVVMLTVYNEEFGDYDSDPGGGGDGSSLDARRSAPVLVLPASADRGA